jgi:hypothetical protein
MMTVKVATRTITGTSQQFTDAVTLAGYFNLSITGTWAGTVTVQRSFDKGDTWYDVATFTESIQEYGLEPEKDTFYRIGCKENGLASGTVTVRLSQ